MSDTYDLSQDEQGEQIAAEPDTRTLNERRSAAYSQFLRIDNDLTSLESALAVADTTEAVDHVAAIFARVLDALTEF